MKSIINENKQVEESRPFSKLMRHKRDPTLIVIFVCHRDGIVIHRSSNSGYYLFEHSTNWRMENFEDFEGSVTLSNE